MSKLVRKDPQHLKHKYSIQGHYSAYDIQFLDIFHRAVEKNNGLLLVGV
jgi:hypothetical protein